MERKKLNIEPFRGKNSTTYTGRPQGKSARALLHLDELDGDNDTYLIEIPEGTSTFNPSFFLGLFFESIKKLGMAAFEEKYQLKILAADQDVRNVLARNIQDGEKNACIELDNRIGFRNLLNSLVT